MKISKNNIIPKGFKVCGIHCGIKKSKNKDLGLIYSQLPCSAAGMFTSNRVQADSLKICREHLSSKESRAVVVNSGNANCFVGKRGFQDAISIVKTTGKYLGIPNRSILTASTGIIGRPLPLKIIKEAIPKLCQGLEKGKLKDFAESILTTDTFKKVVSLKLKIKNKPVLITGIAKGAGMVYPHLQATSKRHATMLVFIMADIAVKKTLLEDALKKSVDSSFNCITVDGCMSTNDSVLVLANGAAKNKPIVKKDKGFKLFCVGLSHICGVLARMIIEDGEGATRRIEISVKTAKSMKEAKLAAEAVANSNLFKTAMSCGNPNWGRIVAAIGAAGIPIKENKLEISFNRQRIFKKGKIFSMGLRNSFRFSKVISVGIKLNRGRFNHCVETCDLTANYVRINAGYN
ncbi:bifunctional glutamate N-acetyltransferase/amino-acid acetyltransferase ArgJ [bacterium]|nr:bifunctional glutamate N-acetyltransferase/amino-acid acetyltransferase ArgJ [bacterium]